MIKIKFFYIFTLRKKDQYLISLKYNQLYNVFP